MKRLDALFLAVVPALILSACDTGGSGGSAQHDPTETVVEVAFRDSSVPPDYHRSWKLTLDDEEIHLVVDSYGDVLADETAPMPAQEWERFVEDLEANHADLEVPDENEACPGGTGMSLTVTDGPQLDVESCGGSGKAVMGGITDPLEPFLALVDFEEHTAT